MSLSLAIKKLISDKGKEILKQKNLYNYLDDYGAFKNHKFSKHIVKLLIEEDCIKRIISSKKKDMTLTVQDISMQLHQKYGINKENTISVLNSIIIGIGKKIVNSETSEDIEKDEPLFDIDLNIEKRIITCADILGGSLIKCAQILYNQKKYDESIIAYQIGANKGDELCLIELTKIYLSDKLYNDYNKAKTCCVMYYNTFFDKMDAKNNDISDIEDILMDSYAKGFLEIIRCALLNGKKIIVHKNIKLFVFGGLIMRIIKLLGEEIEYLSYKINEIKGRFNNVIKLDSAKQELDKYTNSLKEYTMVQEYLNDEIKKISKYDGQSINVTKVKI